MTSSQNSSIQIKPEETYKLVLQCIRKVNNIARSLSESELQTQTGLINQLKYFLFRHSKFLLFFSLFYLCCLPILGVISNYIKNFWFRLFLILFFFIVYILTVFLPLVLIPKVKLEWDKKWENVKKCYIEEVKRIFTNQQEHEKKARIALKRSITYYTRKGQYLKLIIDFTFGSIFIGSLPDTDFQKAIIGAILLFSEKKIPVIKVFITLWNANHFASVCLILLPPLTIVYSAMFKYPIAEMENVLNEIELDE